MLDVDLRTEQHCGLLDENGKFKCDCNSKKINFKNIKIFLRKGQVKISCMNMKCNIIKLLVYKIISIIKVQTVVISLFSLILIKIL